MADPFNSTTPADGDYAIFGAAELRAIKNRLNLLAAPANSQGVFSFRNRAINPTFLFDQVLAGGVYLNNGADLDGWFSTSTAPTVLARQQVLVSDAGVRQLTITTPDAAITAADLNISYTNIEGNYVRDFLQGQAIATGFTCSFLASSTIPGNYAIAFRNGALTRSYVTTFNIPIANVPTPIVIAVPGDLAGVWAYDTAVGLNITFDHGSGSNYVAPILNQWQAGNYITATGVVQQASTLNATTNVRKFQINPYPVAAPVFELPPYLSQLEYCRRYYEKSYDVGTAVATITDVGAMVGIQAVGAVLTAYFSTIFYKTSKRLINPIVTILNPAAANNQIRNQATGTDYTATTWFTAGPAGFSISGTTPATSGVGNPGTYHWTSDARML